MSQAAEFQHEEMLKELNNRTSISEKLAFFYALLRRDFGFIHRIGVAIHDPKADCLKTFAQVTDGENPVPQYQYSLSEMKSFQHLIPEGRPCAINDLSLLDSHDQTSRHLVEQGFRSTYTIPAYDDNRQTGFVFFNSRQPNAFQEHRLPYLDMIARQFLLLANLELEQG